MKKMDEILSAAYSHSEEPAKELNEQVIRKIQIMENDRSAHITGRKKRLPAAAAVAVAAVLALSSVSATAYAAWRRLSAGNVAEHVGEIKLAEFLASKEDETGIAGQTQHVGGYIITFMGAVHGDEVYPYLSTTSTINSNIGGTYFFISIEREDGEPMPNNVTDFYLTPYISGMNPSEFNLHRVDGGTAKAFVQDGVRYYVIGMTKLSEKYADRTFYFAVKDTVNGSVNWKNSYFYDETTGEISRNEDYDGVNALFVFPVNPLLKNTD